MTDNLPPESDFPSAGADNDTPELEQKSVQFTPDQLDALGFGNCEPGATFTVELAAGEKSGDGPDAGQSFDVISSAPSSEDGEGGGAGPEQSPGESDDAGAPPPAILDLLDQLNNPGMPGGEPSDDSVLGFKRTPKTPRIGLPDSKKMRNL